MVVTCDCVVNEWKKYKIPPDSTNLLWTDTKIIFFKNIKFFLNAPMWTTIIFIWTHRLKHFQAHRFFLHPSRLESKVSCYLWNCKTKQIVNVKAFCFLKKNVCALNSSCCALGLRKLDRFENVPKHFWLLFIWWWFNSIALLESFNILRNSIVQAYWFLNL